MLEEKKTKREKTDIKSLNCSQRENIKPFHLSFLLTASKVKINSKGNLELKFIDEVYVRDSI